MAEADPNRTAQAGTLEGVGGQYDFAISAIEFGLVLDIFEAGNADSDEAHVKSIQA